MAQTQTKRAERGIEPLVCTFGNCKKLQCEDGEFCDKHIKIEHKAVKCNVKGCKNEASRWIGTDKLSGDFDMRARDTFYLCPGHAEIMTKDNDDSILFLNPETGKIREIELAVYSCSEKCEQCVD